MQSYTFPHTFQGARFTELPRRRTFRPPAGSGFAGPPARRYDVPMLLGAHLSIAGGLHRALTAAAGYGFNAVALFLRNQV